MRPDQRAPRYVLKLNVCFLDIWSLSSRLSHGPTVNNLIPIVYCDPIVRCNTLKNRGKQLLIAEHSNEKTAEFLHRVHGHANQETSTALSQIDPGYNHRALAVVGVFERRAQHGNSAQVSADFRSIS